LATTDADSRVPPRWLASQLAAHGAGVNVWTGRVSVEDWSPDDEGLARRWNDAYEDEKAPIHGASLGFDARMYLEVGGFALVRTGEDRALYEAIVDAGGLVHDDRELRVITSGRRQGRAPLGFAHALDTFDERLRSSA
jgi:hypothetical protein